MKNSKSKESAQKALSSSSCRGSAALQPSAGTGRQFGPMTENSYERVANKAPILPLASTVREGPSGPFILGEKSGKTSKQPFCKYIIVFIVSLVKLANYLYVNKLCDNLNWNKNICINRHPKV